MQTDALVNNELGNPFDLISPESPLSHSELTAQENLTLLNLTYDVTPPDLISCVVTDMGMLPCTSVPVVLRVKNRDNYAGGLTAGAGGHKKSHAKDDDLNTIED